MRHRQMFKPPHRNAYAAVVLSVRAGRVPSARIRSISETGINTRPLGPPTLTCAITPRYTQLRSCPREKGEIFAPSAGLTYCFRLLTAFDSAFTSFEFCICMKALIAAPSVSWEDLAQ